MSHPVCNCQRRFAEVDELLSELEDRNRQLIALSRCLRTRQEWAEEYAEGITQWRIQLNQSQSDFSRQIDELEIKIQKINHEIIELTIKFSELSLS